MPYGGDRRGFEPDHDHSATARRAVACRAVAGDADVSAVASAALPVANGLLV
jgi:hypothetical protein